VKSFSVSAAAVLFCFSMGAAAESGTAPDPMDQAVKSTVENWRQKPNNSGLQRAVRQLLDNQRAFDERRATKSNAKVDRPERIDRIDRVDQQVVADLPGRSELARGRRK
jgi:hypothetical protein